MEPINRREALAFIALTDAPSIKRVAFYGPVSPSMHIRVETVADLLIWRSVFGLTAGPEAEDIGDLRCRGEWRGWTVLLVAESPEPSPVEPIDNATREALREVTK